MWILLARDVSEVLYLFHFHNIKWLDSKLWIVNLHACRHSFCSSCMWAVNVFAKFANNFHCPAPSWWEFSDRWRQYLLVRISFRSGMEKLESDHWPTNWIWTVVKQALVLAPEFLSSSNQLGFFRGCKLTNSVKNDLLLRNPKQRTKHQQAQTVF